MKTITECRVCGSRNLEPVLSLGTMPPANRYPSFQEINEPEERYPLDVDACYECCLLQLRQVVPPDTLYRQYAFRTSTSKTMTEHFRSLMNNLVQRCGKDPFIVEIGSNDGTALKPLADAGVRHLGVDPSENLSNHARNLGVNVLVDHFSKLVARSIISQEGRADAIVACNVVGHIDDIHDAFAGARELLAGDGLFIVEVPDVENLINYTQYDTIYHEHLSYLSHESICRLAEAHGMRVVGTTALPVHGGSTRFYIRKGSPRERSRIIHWKFNKTCLSAFALRTKYYITAFSRFIEANKKAEIVGFGASAKAGVVLNVADVGPDGLQAVVDCTPEKQYRYMPGTHQPILPEATLQKLNPDILVLFVWNHSQEAMSKLEKFSLHGCKIVTPNLAELHPPLETVF